MHMNIAKISSRIALTSLLSASCSDLLDADQDGYAAETGDCDDQEPTVHPGAVELAGDLRDQNCNGDQDEDRDRDGYSEDGSLGGTPDCDDRNPQIFPGKQETPNSADDDCDGLRDEDTDAHDDDQDGYSEAEGDCNDAAPAIHPGTAELPDGVDQNCNGVTDERTELYDDDGDGFSEVQGDCDDGDPSRAPGKTESLDGIDNNCNGAVDEQTDGSDDDGDGYSEADGDCNDLNPAVHPGADELEDDLDNDCDNKVDEDSPDSDDDGDGLSENQGDCDDNNKTVFPGAPEYGNAPPYLGDKIDNDCDGQIDEGTWSCDDDGDGFSEDGTVGGASDCDDTNPAIYPGAPEVLKDGIDSDCDKVYENSNPSPPLDDNPDGLALSIDDDGDICDSLVYTQSLAPFSPPVQFGVRFYDIRDDGADHPNIQGQLDSFLADANSAFAAIGVGFVHAATIPVNNSSYNKVVAQNGNLGDAIAPIEDDLCGGPCDNGDINVFIANEIGLFDDKNNFVALAGGVGYYPSSQRHTVFLFRKWWDSGQGTFLHELGHVFGLFHTHHGLVEAEDGLPELADGSNCEEAGDLLCDTPADPRFRESAVDPLFCERETPACQPDCTNNVDAQLYAPDMADVMSYYTDACLIDAPETRYTEQQRQRMLCAIQESNNLQTVFSPTTMASGYSIIKFDMPCDGDIHVFEGLPPVDGQQRVAVPVVTYYGYNDNDPSYSLNWTLGADAVTVFGTCDSGTSLQGYVAVLGLPEQAKVVTTDFVVAPLPGDGCAETAAMLPQLDDALYADTLRFIAPSTVVGDGEDDMSWQIRLEQNGDAWSYWGRLNGHSGAYIKGTILQIGLPAGYAVHEAQPQPGCFKQQDGQMALEFPKDPGHDGVVLLSVPHYVTEDASERGGVDSCNTVQHISKAVCAGNTGDWHGFTAVGAGAIPLDATGASVILSSSGNKSEAAVGSLGLVLQFPKK